MTGENGWGKQGIIWINEDWQKPVCFLFWRYGNDEIGVLLGNLETGITGNSQFAVKGILDLKNNRFETREKAGFAPGWIKEWEHGVRIALPSHKACLIFVKRIRVVLIPA